VQGCRGQAHVPGFSQAQQHLQMAQAEAVSPVCHGMPISYIKKYMARIDL
jgi:hypothetical protein